MVNICNYIFVTGCTTQRVNLMCLYVCTHTHRLLDPCQRPLRLHPLPPAPSFYSMCFSFDSFYDLSSSLLSFLLLLFFLIYCWKILKMLSLTSSSLSTCPPIFLPNNTLRPVSSGPLRAKSFAPPSPPPTLSCPVSGNLPFIKDFNDNSCPRNWDHAWWVFSLIFFFLFFNPYWPGASSRNQYIMTLFCIMYLPGDLHVE